MCGRVRLSSDVSEIKFIFSIPPHRPTPNFPQSWNVAPTDPLPVVRYDAKAGGRSLDLLRWGLIPYWEKDIKVGFANMRRPRASRASRRFARRSSVAAASCRSMASTNGKRPLTGKQPYAIALSDRRLMALAGIWENWRSPAGEWMRTFAIITTAPNELCAELHNRMPAVLQPEAWSLWLGQEPAEPAELKALLKPFPSEEMTCWPVSPRSATSGITTRA